MNNTQENILENFTEESFLRLQHYNKELSEEITRLTIDNLYYKNENGQLKRLIFGTKSERFISIENSSQLQFGFDTTEVKAEAEVVKTETITYQRKQKEDKKQIVHSRQPLPSHLPRHEVVIEPEEKPVGAKKIGEEITEILEYTPGILYVKKYVRPKYIIQRKEEDKEASIIIGELPSLPIPKGNAGQGLLTHIIIGKFVDHLSIYRQVQQFKRLGVEIAESSMIDWIRQSCDLMSPLYGKSEYIDHPLPME